MSASLLLLADSQLLFRQRQVPALFQRIRSQFEPLKRPVIKAAYIGAANGHQSEFYQLATEALSGLLGQPVQTDMITSVSELPDNPVDIVILAGGSVSEGWLWLNQSKVRNWLDRCFRSESTLLVGISAGAIHMARGCDPEAKSGFLAAQAFMDWLPAFVAVHEEAHGWPSLVMSASKKPDWPAVGIPFGSGLWVENETLYSVGKPCFHSFPDGKQRIIPPLNQKL